MQFHLLKHCPTAAGVNATAKQALDAIVAQSGTGLMILLMMHHWPISNKQTMNNLLQTAKSMIFGVMVLINFNVGDYWNEASVYIGDASNTDDVALYRIEDGKFYQGTAANASNEVTWSNSVLTTEVNEVQASRRWTLEICRYEIGTFIIQSFNEND